MAWLLNEDEALKLKLTGLTVNDRNKPTGRAVPVRFSLPETELSAFTYPLIMIEHGPVSKADDREHRGFLHLQYVPEGFSETINDDGYADLFSEDHPIPYNIDYTITTYTREAMQDRELTAQLAQFDYLPSRFGYLTIPEDGTVRRLDLIGGPDAQEVRDANQKRVFRKTYIIRVSSELFLYQVRELAKVLEVDLDVDSIPPLPLGHTP